MPLFNRKIELIIGNPGSEEALSITGLKVVFDIKKTKTIIPNSGKIQVYNISEKSRNLIQDRKSWVLLRAGHDNNAGLQDVYKGTIVRTSFEKRKPDTVLVIDAQDGVGQQTARVSLGYPENTSAKTIIAGILNTMRMPMKNSSVDIPDKAFSGGFSTVGTAESALSRVCRVLGLDWCIQNEEMLFTRIGEGNTNPVVLISSTTGMVDSPVKVANVVPNVDQANVPGADFVPQMSSSGGIQFMVGGYRIKTLLLPTIEPKDRLSVASFDIPRGSIYIAETVTHTGDTFGNDFNTTIEAYEEKV